MAVKEEEADGDPLATSELPATSSPGLEKITVREQGSGSGSGRLEVRCPNCHAPTEVAVDTSLTDLTCGSCGSHFSLVDQSKATRMAPSLSKLGRFQLIERIGVGGFGSVWKARDKELDRTVAVKIPRVGGMTGEEQEKFFREARAAAQLKHPNIVSVHEVGRNGDSLYIVSDFVRGATLGDWLTGQQLTNREAAELCAIIADALHHAHEQGIVHRDLKPANIMMDGDNKPHLMDFGLARREVGEVTVTVDGQILGTPAYMSPEQAQGEAHTADRRSDIYSLGVILFQLLTGELPFRGNARMLIKQVIDDEPPSPRKLNANVSKDLETITLKCLEKVPARRYQSADDVASELHRFLKDEPICARPIGRVERAWRWMKRNPQVATLGGIVVLVLSLGTLISTWQAVRATRAENLAGQRLNAEIQSRKEAEAVTDFLVSAIESTDPQRDGRTVTVAEVLDQANKHLEADLSDQPLTQAALLFAIGKARLALGEGKAALVPLARAKDLQEKYLGADHPNSLVTTCALARAYISASVTGARPLLEQTVERATKTLGMEHAITLDALDVLADVSSVQMQTAINLRKEVLDVRIRKLGAEHPDTLSTMIRLAAAYCTAHRPKDALPLLEKVVPIQQRKLGADHPQTLYTMNILANAESGMGHYDEAIRLYEEGLQAKRKRFGFSHPENSKSANNLILVVNKRASAHRNAGRLEAARQSVDDFVAHLLQRGEFVLALRLVRPEQLGHLILTSINYDHNIAQTPVDALVVGELRLYSGNPEPAVRAILSAIVRGASHHSAYKSLGWALLAQGRPTESNEAFRNALTSRRQENNTYNLAGANPDELTAAYFLDLITEQNYVDSMKDREIFACFPWFYIAQRAEIEGKTSKAITAYRRCAELGKVEGAQIRQNLVQWLLKRLSAPPPSGEK